MHGHITRIYTQHWLELPKDVRLHLSKVLGINRTGISEVRDATVISDGYTNNDLSVITTPKLAEYTGKSGEFTELWKVAVNKALKEINKSNEVIYEQKEVTNKENSKQEEVRTETVTTGAIISDTVPAESKPLEGSGETSLSNS